MKQFDSIIEVAEDFAQIFNDKLSDPQIIIQKLIEILEKRQSDIENVGLFRMNTVLEEIIKEVEKYQDRVKITNKPG